ncbi:unnamed protein product [Staurois parvus]|uniref:Uncharacterized protein n=1 Tax=Staurois parvus TaxID=386267 RepID=A0ABN9BG42_9NEOB|nr:unnamed protein product [Staurois parvus]
MGLTMSPSHTAVLVCERPGCTRPLVIASSPKERSTSTSTSTSTVCNISSHSDLLTLHLLGEKGGG